MESCKVVFADYVKNKKLKENVDNYEQFKVKELYAAILFDDGRAPSGFEKDQLVRDRHEINEVINKDVRISSKNLRGMKHSKPANAREGN